MDENKIIEKSSEKDEDKLIVIGDIGMATISHSDFYFNYDIDKGTISVLSTIDDTVVPIQNYNDVDADKIFLIAYEKMQNTKVLNLCEIVDEVIK